MKGLPYKDNELVEQVIVGSPPPRRFYLPRCPGDIFSYHVQEFKLFLAKADDALYEYVRTTSV